MIEDLEVRAEQLEREHAHVRKATDYLRGQLADTQKQSADLRDLLGASEDGAPLGSGPLFFALVGVVGACLADFAGYVVFLIAQKDALSKEHTWLLAAVLGLTMSLATLPLSKRAGAGGKARVLLRRTTIALCLFGTLELIAAFILSNMHTTRVG